jgi:predicted metal-dependent phosphotriesterase family hydrolase
MAMIIQTVTGPIEPERAGVTMSHEHVLVDGWGMFGTYDAILHDDVLAIAELGDFTAAGGGTIVDCTNAGIGRDPGALRAIAEAAGVSIVMGAGWYRERVYPPEVRQSSARELADRLVAEITDGVEGTGIRPGMIGEIGTERYAISAAEERVFRAAARAQRRTGVAIWTHTTHGGDLAAEQIALLTGEGVPPDRIVVSHMGDRIGYRHLDPIARTGVYLSVDNIGYVGGGYPSDDVRADNVAQLVASGHGARVMLGGDTCTKSALLAYGGKGYGHILRRFVPMLRERGVGEDAITMMLVDNPRRVLAFDDAGLARSGPAAG